MQIVTKENCQPCNQLKKMLKNLDVNYNECTIDDLPERFKNAVTGYPALFIGTNLLFCGSPGSFESLESRLHKVGVI